MRTSIQHTETGCMIYQNGWRISPKIQWTKECQHQETHPEADSEPCRKVLSGRYSIFTHIPKDRNCEVCKGTKITRAPCRNRTGNPEPRAGKFGDLMTASHKVFNLETITDTQSWYNIWPLNGCNHARVKPNLLRRRKRVLRKFLERSDKPKVVYTDNFMEFGKACEELSWNYCTSTPNRSETNGIAERAVRWIK